MSFILLIFLLSSIPGFAFFQPKYRSKCWSFPAGRGFGDTSLRSKDSSNVKIKERETRSVQQDVNNHQLNSFNRAAAKDPGAAAALIESYGGDIKRGTAERICRARAALPPVYQKAMELRSEILRWEQKAKSMSILQVAFFSMNQNTLNSFSKKKFCSCAMCHTTK